MIQTTSLDLQRAKWAFWRLIAAKSLSIAQKQITATLQYDCHTRSQRLLPVRIIPIGKPRKMQVPSRSRIEISGFLISSFAVSKTLRDFKTS
jgi:hypothetical protein